MKVIKNILCVTGIIIVAALVLFLLLVAFLSIREYRPGEIEKSKVSGGMNLTKPKEGDDISILLWNIGYCDLGDNADFFMSYGKNIRSSSKARAKENLSEIIKFLKSENPDVIMLQEIDLNSTRSYHINQMETIGKSIPEKAKSFAYNFNVDFIPYPMPPIGKVRSGLATYVPYQVTDAYRQALPVPFKWPIRLANLKRCMLVNRIPIEGSDRELVLINLHLEAFDNGEGKIAQTKKLQSVLEAEYEKGNYVIAGGDYNQVFSNTDASMYTKKENCWQPGALDINDFSDHWQFRQDNTYPTCRSTNTVYVGEERNKVQYYMLDGFIVSDNITIKSVETQNLDFVNSDHNPVIMKLTLN